MSNRSRRLGWLVIAVAAAALLAVGVARSGAPRTADERQLAIARRIACPVCDGESVAESGAISAQQIRERIASLVGEGQLDDDTIVASIDAGYVEELSLTPSRSGLDLLAWVLPAVAGVLTVGGLIVAFGRWRASAAMAVTDADRVLVARAIADDLTLQVRASGGAAGSSGAVDTPGINAASAGDPPGEGVGR